MHIYTHAYITKYCHNISDDWRQKLSIELKSLVQNQHYAFIQQNCMLPWENGFSHDYTSAWKGISTSVLSSGWGHCWKLLCKIIPSILSCVCVCIRVCMCCVCMHTCVCMICVCVCTGRQFSWMLRIFTMIMAGERDLGYFLLI